MWFKKRLSQRGDTIVEVLIVLSVLGLAFGISSATANRSLQQSRNAEEHSQAMGVLSSQIEMVRKALASGVTLPNTIGQKFCMTSDSAYATTDSPTCNSGSIPFSSAVEVKNGYYELVVSWDGVGTMGTQQEIYKYKIYDVFGNAAGGSGTGGAGGGVSISPNPPPPPPPLPSRPTISYFRYDASNFNSTVATGNTRRVNAGGSATWNLPPTIGSLNGAISWAVLPGADAASVDCTLGGAGNPAAVGANGSRSANLGKPSQGRYTLTCVSKNVTGQSSSVSSNLSVDVTSNYSMLYRCLNLAWTLDHFYTHDRNCELMTSGANQGRPLGYTNTGSLNAGEVTLNRFSGPSDHLYTVSPGAYSGGYGFEGGVGGVLSTSQCVAGSSPIYRLTSAEPGDIDNFYTQHVQERDAVNGSATGGNGSPSLKQYSIDLQQESGDRYRYTMSGPGAGVMNGTLYLSGSSIFWRINSGSEPSREMRLHALNSGGNPIDKLARLRFSDNYFGEGRQPMQVGGSQYNPIYQSTAFNSTWRMTQSTQILSGSPYSPSRARITVTIEYFYSKDTANNGAPSAGAVSGRMRMVGYIKQGGAEYCMYQ